MRILVIEDTQKHIDAAREQLKEHDLTIATTVLEAYKILIGINQLEKPPFDIVMTDLYLPAPADNEFSGWGYYPSDPDKDPFQKGASMPAGLAFAIIASQQGSKVGILSDTNHHDDQISALLDLALGGEFSGGRENKKNRSIYCPDGRHYIDYEHGQCRKEWDNLLKALLKLS